jgi:putative hydrolase of the HAD superfamily
VLRAPLRGVLFDLDNTLVHRNRSIARYAERFVADFSEQLEATSSAHVARAIELQDNGGYLPHDSEFLTIKDAVAHALTNDLSWKISAKSEEIADHWSSFFPQCAVEMDGAEALVCALAARHLNIGVVSNGAERSRVKTVAQLSFRRHIAFVLSSERADVRKPDARIFTAAAAELGLTNDQCVFVGDHPLNDVAGALAAGMSAIWFDGFHLWPTDLALKVPVACSLAEVGNHITQMSIR